MPAVVLIGAQWGDEGKGKATDLSGAPISVIGVGPGRDQNVVRRDLLA